MFREFWVSYRQCCSDCVRVRGAGTPPRCGWSPWARLRAAAGEPVLAEVVVTDLVLGLAGEVGVAYGDGVNVPRPVALGGAAHPCREADLAQRAGGRGAGGGSHPLDRDVDGAAAVVGTRRRGVAAGVVRTLLQYEVAAEQPLRLDQHVLRAGVDDETVGGHPGPGLDDAGDREAAGTELGERCLARQAVGVETGVAERFLVLRVGGDRRGAEVTVHPLRVE